MTVHSKLNKARIKFHALPLKKSGHNKFAGYRYFELGDFLVPALQICDEVGISCTISIAGDSATMRIVDVEDGSTVILNTPLADASTKGQLPIQSLGSQHTYVRRYLWMLALEIVEHDAIDAVAGSVEPAAVGVDADKLAILQDLIDKTGTDIAALCKHYKVKALADLTPEKYSAAVQVLSMTMRETEGVILESSTLPPSVKRGVGERGESQLSLVNCLVNC